MMLEGSDPLWKAAYRFTRHFALSEDLDPVYPVLEYLIRDMGDEDQVRVVLTYLSYYNTANTLRGLDMDFFKLPADWSFGFQRRNLRGGKLKQHQDSIDHLLGLYGTFVGWLTHDFTGDPRHDWNQVQDNYREAWGNGRFAAYKLAEILLRCADWDLEPTDMSMAFSSGPRKGLALFFPGSENLTRTNDAAELEHMGRQFLRRLNKRESFGYVGDLAQAETVLCDFGAMHRGNYYVGRDIDKMQGELIRAELDARSASRMRRILEPAWEARKAVFPKHYLGEYGDWDGMDRDRLKHFARTGEVVVR